MCYWYWKSLFGSVEEFHDPRTSLSSLQIAGQLVVLARQRTSAHFNHYVRVSGLWRGRRAQHHTYTPDFSPCDYFPFPKFKLCLKRNTSYDCDRLFDAHFKTIPEEFWWLLQLLSKVCWVHRRLFRINVGQNCLFSSNFFICLIKSRNFGTHCVFTECYTGSKKIFEVLDRLGRSAPLGFEPSTFRVPALS